MFTDLWRKLKPQHDFRALEPRRDEETTRMVESFDTRTRQLRPLKIVERVTYDEHGNAVRRFDT